MGRRPNHTSHVLQGLHEKHTSRLRPILYANAPKTTLQLLDRIQNHALRLTIGAALHSETDIVPLFIRRIKLTEQYVFRAIATSQINILQQFLNIQNTWRFIKTPPLLSEIYKELSHYTNVAFKTNRYGFFQLPYFEIFYQWPR